MLALRGCSDDGIDLPWALDQIQGWQTARHKLPSWSAIDGIVTSEIGIETKQTSVLFAMEESIGSLVSTQSLAQWEQRRIFSTHIIPI